MSEGKAHLHMSVFGDYYEEYDQQHTWALGMTIFKFSHDTLGSGAQEQRELHSFKANPPFSWMVLHFRIKQGGGGA